VVRGISDPPCATEATPSQVLTHRPIQR